VKEASHRRRGLFFIGFISVLILILLVPSIFMMSTLFLRPPEVIYSNPGESMTISNGEWFAKGFIIDDDHSDCGVGVDGVLFSHNFKVDNIVLEFGYAPLSLTSFMSLNETEKRDSFWGFSSGGSMSQSGTEYSREYPGVGPLGEYVWAIRFIDLDNNSTVFETTFAVSLRSI
jgi:hypothetical protein